MYLIQTPYMFDTHAYTFEEALAAVKAMGLQPGEFTITPVPGFTVPTRPHQAAGQSPKGDRMTLSVFYNPKQNAPVTGYSPSAGKPQQVVADWLASNHDIRIETFEPVTRDDLCLAHDRAYVNGVLDLTIDNGFNDRNPDVAASLPYTSGSMLAAAEYAVVHKTIACSPTSGFHHAGHAFGGGFCTFNGLIVTARKLHNAGLVQTVGILDCDHHYGNGTADIIGKLNLNWIKHHTSGRHDLDGQSYFRWLGRALDDLQACDVILYQAGADPHTNDPLGGLLTDKQLYRRDVEVFEFAKGNRIPLAWNLAGGYRRDKSGGISPVLATHRNTLIACLGLADPT